MLPLNDPHDPCVDHAAHENEDSRQCGWDGAGPAGGGQSGSA